MKTRWLVLFCTTLACGGGGGSSGTGGSKANGGGVGGAAGTGAAGGNGGAGNRGGGGAGAGGAGGAGGMAMTGSRKLVGGRARLVGGPVSACSTPPGNGDRWCAFTLPSAMPIGATELWVLNVTKALTADIPCDGTNAACLKLTSTLWTGMPTNASGHPFIHRFHGEVLFLFPDPPTPVQTFKGTVLTWRPGWPQAKPLSGPNAISCEGHPSADSALCLEDLHLDATPPYFDVHAGRVNGNPLPLASRIYPSNDKNAQVWSIAFSPAGDYFAYSTGGATPTDPETLYAYKIDEVGMAAKRITVGNFAQWGFSADGKRWLYMRDYNYPPRNSAIEPSGTLMAADFPAGGNPTMLATQVGAFIPLGDGSSAGGVAFLDQLTNGKGTYKIVRDLGKPTDVVTISQNIMAAEVSPDGRFSMLHTQFATSEIADAIIVKNDGTGRCALAMGPTAAQLGTWFLPHSARVFWADNVDKNTLVGSGWMANPDGCTDKQQFSTGAELWFFAGDKGLLFSEPGTANTSTLNSAKLSPGFPASGATTLRMGIDLIYAPLGPDLNYVVYQITSGGPDDGLYVYGPIGF
jgi:hypothetical protein